MKTSLIHFKTKDRLDLPGILYEPDRKKSQKVVLLLHGNGPSSYFYKQEKMKKIAQKFIDKGFSVLAFSNRGAHWIYGASYIDKKGEEQDYLGGAWFELIKECLIDIDAAISFLKKKNYHDFTLWGHSTGANKICVYNYYKKRNPVSRYILSSGGDDKFCWENVGSCVDLLKENCSNPKFFTFKIFKGADHGFWPRENEYYNYLINWVTK